MATVLNRTTKQLIHSANTPDYPESDWIIEPDLSAIVGFSSKYWVIAGDIITLMTQAERDTVDIVELEAQKDNIADVIDTDPYLEAFALVVLDELNILRTNDGLGSRTKAQLKTAVRSKL